MGTKNNPAPYDCYANALPDEPMFILLARDPIAPRIVREWADGLEAAIKGAHKPESDRAKVEEAWQCSHAMQDWRRDHYGEWHDPQLPVATLPAVRRAVLDKLGKAGRAVIETDERGQGVGYSEAMNALAKAVAEWEALIQ